MAEELKNSKKVLVIETVEDDPALRQALRDKLGLEGFKVLEAKDGEEGLTLALQERPDLILLDILMPKMDGLALMKELRGAGTWGKNVPIILLTNLAPDDERINQAVTENEPAYYLVKSNWAINDLIDKIRERLSRV